MKIKLKHISIILIFTGLFLSCFQFTINKLTKFNKVNSIELSLEDIDDNEEESETKKIELEDDYFFSEFNFSFSNLTNNKLKLFCAKQKNCTSPVITINTPPPKK